jgi:hypothetical protein
VEEELEEPDPQEPIQTCSGEIIVPEAYSFKHD